MEPSAGSSARYRSVWWTLYILDRRFSSLMGAPVSIHDADVTVPLPSSGDLSEGYEALAMHVKLSRVITSVLNCEIFPCSTCHSFILLTILCDFSGIWIRWKTEPIFCQTRPRSASHISHSCARIGDPFWSHKYPR